MLRSAYGYSGLLALKAIRKVSASLWPVCLCQRAIRCCCQRNRPQSAVDFLVGKVKTDGPDVLFRPLALLDGEVVGMVHERYQVGVVTDYETGSCISVGVWPTHSDGGMDRERGLSWSSGFNGRPTTGSAQRACRSGPSARTESQDSGSAVSMPDARNRACSRAISLSA